MRHLELRHLFAEVVDGPRRVLVAESALLLAREAGQLFLVAGSLLGGVDGAAEVSKEFFQRLLRRRPAFRVGGRAGG